MARINSKFPSSRCHTGFQFGDIVEAMAQASKEGKGAVSLDGRLIDIASIRMAEALLKKAEAMGVG